MVIGFWAFFYLWHVNFYELPSYLMHLPQQLVRIPPPLVQYSLRIRFPFQKEQNQERFGSWFCPFHQLLPFSASFRQTVFDCIEGCLCTVLHFQLRKYI